MKSQGLGGWKMIESRAVFAEPKRLREVVGKSRNRTQPRHHYLAFSVESPRHKRGILEQFPQAA
jgi:hypothetical protein